MEILAGLGNWLAIARLDGVGAGKTVSIAFTDAQSQAGTGILLKVQGEGGDPTWEITPAISSVTEGNTALTFTITRDGAGLPLETVYVSTTMNKGFYNDRDYSGLLNVPVSFLAGETTKTITVNILSDT